MRSALEPKDAIRVENAGVSDVSIIAAIWLEANNARRKRRSTDEAEEVEDLLRSRIQTFDALFVLAKKEDRVVGIGHQLPARMDDGASPEIVPGLMHLSMVAIEPARWGAGIGKIITGYCIDRASELGYDTIQLWTHASNERAQRLYASAGFKLAGREKMDENGERIRLYRRTLR